MLLCFVEVYLQDIVLLDDQFDCDKGPVLWVSAKSEELLVRVEQHKFSIRKRIEKGRIRKSNGAKPESLTKSHIRYIPNNDGRQSNQAVSEGQGLAMYSAALRGDEFSDGTQQSPDSRGDFRSR